MTKRSDNAKNPQLILKLKFGPGNLERLESVLRERRDVPSSVKEVPPADDALPTRRRGRTDRKQTTPAPMHSVLDKGKSDLDENGNLAEYYLSLKVYSCDPRDCTSRDDLLAISPGKLLQHIQRWESRVGIVSKQHPDDDDQICIPAEAKYILLTEKTHGGYQFPVILFCEKLDKTRPYESKAIQTMWHCSTH